MEFSEPELTDNQITTRDPLLRGGERRDAGTVKKELLARVAAKNAFYVEPLANTDAPIQISPLAYRPPHSIGVSPAERTYGLEAL